MFLWQDYVVIAIYLAFMLVIGLCFRNANRDTSDYFRGGGQMSWWMTGATAFMANFSAWTFVACGGRIYETGTLIILTTFLLQGLIGIVMAFTWVVWFRRMRVITPVDAIRRRFGLATEQVYAWQTVITQFLLAGVGLFTLSVFIAPLLDIPIWACIAITGGVIAFMSVTGGAWAVVASDFVQMLVIVVIVVITVVLVLVHPSVGGLGGLIRQAPTYQFDWSEYTQLPVMITFIVGSFALCLLFMFNMAQGAGRFLYVRSDKDAKLAAAMFAVGFLVVPAIWFIPVIAGSFLLPDLATDPRFASLKNPEEAAYLATAALVLPPGMLGMLACGIFAATMSMMDSGLNRNSGILIRNIYLPLIRPQASEREMLLLSKISTALIGVIMIASGILYARVADFNLFAWTQHINATLIVPMTIPLALGLVFRKTPDWTAWVCILVLAVCSFVLKFFPPVPYTTAAAWLGWGSLTPLEKLDFETAVIVLANLALGLGVFVVAGRCYRPRQMSAEALARVEAFDRDLRRPVETSPAEHRRTDIQQYRALGGLCCGYGGLIGLCALLPNDLLGRACFLICGGTIAGVGMVMLVLKSRLEKQQDPVRGELPAIPEPAA